MQVDVSIRAFLNSRKSKLSPELHRKLSRYYANARSLGHGSDLNVLAAIYGTDKWGRHFYTQHYQRYFAPIRNKRLKILEIGVGGYSNLSYGAASLRMWKRFFPKAQVVGIDLYDKSEMSERRMKILQCDQTDAEKLKAISQQYGPFDIIIDDGSHINEHVIATFHILFPLLKNPGFYAVEDLQTAYWPSWGGLNGNSSMDFLKSLTDGLNYVEFPVQARPNPFERHITEIAFFHNLCFIRKADNDEPISVPVLLENERQAMRQTSAE